MQYPSRSGRKTVRPVNTVERNVLFFFTAFLALSLSWMFDPFLALALVAFLAMTGLTYFMGKNLYRQISSNP